MKFSAVHNAVVKGRYGYILEWLDVVFAFLAAVPNENALLL